MSEPVLRTERLTKRFGGLTAVDNLSFSLAGGRLHAIIGPNGAGKTTFFNLISGLLTPDAGQVFFSAARSPGSSRTRSAGSASSARCRSRACSRSSRWRRPVDHRPCRAALHPFRLAACDRGTAEKVERTLEQIGLAALAKRQAGTLSYGDVALLEIGMALISAPRPPARRADPAA